MTAQIYVRNIKIWQLKYYARNYTGQRNDWISNTWILALFFQSCITAYGLPSLVDNSKYVAALSSCFF